MFYSRRNCPFGRQVNNGRLLIVYRKLLLNLAFLAKLGNKMSLFECLCLNLPVQKTIILMDKQKIGKRRRMIDLKVYCSVFFLKLKLKRLLALINNVFQKMVYLFSCPFRG